MLIEQKINKIYFDFIVKLQDKPYCIQKADPDSLNMLQDDSKQFIRICSYIL